MYLIYDKNNNTLKSKYGWNEVAGGKSTFKQYGWLNHIMKDQINNFKPSS